MIVLLSLFLVLSSLFYLKPSFTISYIFTKLFSFIAMFMAYRWLGLKEKQTIKKVKIFKILLLAITVNIISLSVFLLDAKIYTFNFQLTFFLFHIANTVISTAIIEEFWYRRILLGEILKRSKNQTLAIFVVSVIFTGAHLAYVLPIIKFYALLHVFIFSLLVSYIYIKTRNLWLVIIVHGVGNLMSYFTPLLFKTVQPLSFSLKAFIFLNVVLFFGYIGVWSLKNIHNKQ